MDSPIAEPRNGVTWIRDCLLNDAAITMALGRIDRSCPIGIRHFSATGEAVPLDRALAMEVEISRLEDFSQDGPAA
jgi:hypothetical protein